MCVLSTGAAKIIELISSGHIQINSTSENNLRDSILEFCMVARTLADLLAG